MRKLSSNVFVVDRHSLSGTYRGCTYGMVTTTDGVVMIDAPMMPTDAVRWRETADRFGRIRYLLTTHHHLDHTAGTFFYMGATGIAHRHTKPLFDEPNDLFTGPNEGVRRRDSRDEMDLRAYVRTKVQDIDPDGLSLLDEYHVSPPSIYFEESLSLSVGDHTFELRHSPGHTAGDVGVYVPEERVYFAGDTVTNGEYPSLAVGNPLQWVHSLERIEALGAEVVVPGHGTAGDASMVTAFRRFLERCIETVRDAIDRGLTREEAMDSISFERFMPALHSGESRRRADVGNVYDALRAE